MHDWLDGAYCWELKENMYLGIKLNPADVRKSIYSYINSKRTTAICSFEEKYRDRKGHPFLYGVSIFDQIIKYINKSDGYLDIRIPYVLVEQKRALQYICKRLECQYYIMNFETNLSNMKFLEKECQLIVYLFIKYNLTERKNIKDSIILYLQKKKYRN